jgi:hypothetical protein
MIEILESLKVANLGNLERIMRTLPKADKLVFRTTYLEISVT